MCGGSSSDNDIEDTPEQRYAAQVAAEKWNFAQKELAPLEDAYMQDVAQMTGDSRMSYIRGQTNQSQMQTTDDLMQQGEQNLQGGGIDPSSGRYQAAMGGLSLDAAQAGGQTGARAQFEQQNQQLQGLQNIIAMGQGQATQAHAGLSGIASQSAAEARQGAYDSFNRSSANLQLVGSAAGAGTRYGMNEGWFGNGQQATGLGGVEGGVSQTAIDSALTINGM